MHSNGGLRVHSVRGDGKVVSTEMAMTPTRTPATAGGETGSNVSRITAKEQEVWWTPPDLLL